MAVWTGGCVRLAERLGAHLGTPLCIGEYGILYVEKALGVFAQKVPEQILSLCHPLKAGTALEVRENLSPAKLRFVTRFVAPGAEYVTRVSL